MKMLKLRTLVLAAVMPLLGMSTVQAGIVLSNASVTSSSGTKNADAAHGFVLGNDTGGNTPDLIELLNTGTSLLPTFKNNGQIDTPLPELLQFKPDGTGGPLQFQIDAAGMFSTDGLSDTERNAITALDTVNTLIGVAVTNTNGADWTYLGKSDDASSPFSNNPMTSSGTLTLTTPVSGNLVLSLKSSNDYSVYAFADVTNATSFDFEIPQGLSHAALYQGTSGPVTSPTLPEPASAAIFGALGLIGLVARRRRNTCSEA